MNANELADKLEDALATDSWCQECGLETTEPVARQAATMLRQQQIRIEELEQCLKDCYVVQKMQSEELYKGQAEMGCYKIELELHKAMIKDLEKALKIKERDYSFMKDLAIGSEELLRKAQEK